LPRCLSRVLIQAGRPGSPCDRLCVLPPHRRAGWGLEPRGQIRL